MSMPAHESSSNDGRPPSEDGWPPSEDGWIVCHGDSGARLLSRRAVRRVSAAPIVTPIPGTTGDLAGIAAIGGDLVLVLSLAQRGRWIAEVEHEGELVGLRVTSAYEAPEVIWQSDGRTATCGGTEAIVFDMRDALTRAEASAFASQFSLVHGAIDRDKEGNPS
jgi:hypothetical protein